MKIKNKLKCINLFLIGIAIIVLCLMIYAVVTPYQKYGFTGNIKQTLLEFEFKNKFVDIANEGNLFYAFERSRLNGIYISLFLLGQMSSESLERILENKSFQIEIFDNQSTIFHVNENVPLKFLSNFDLQVYGENKYIYINGSVIYLEYRQEGEYIRYKIIRETGFFILNYTRSIRK